VAAGLDDFPTNAIPLCLSTVQFTFRGKKSGAGVVVQRSNLRAVPYTGITTHAAQGANTYKTVIHFCIRMLRLLRDPALVLVALTRVRRLRDLLLLSPITMEMMEWVVTADKGAQRQDEWDRLVRSMRARKLDRNLPVSERDKEAWHELDRRDAERASAKRKRDDSPDGGGDATVSARSATSGN